MSPIIEVNNISKSYNKILALDSISFSVDQGELFGLIGSDGAGKTTLFRILTTLLLANSGTAKVIGLDVVCDYKKIRSKIGYMPGKFSLYTDLSVEENLTFFATIFGTTIKENYYLVKDIYSQIEPFKNRKAGKLSGGMKQKLALSCALIHKPELLILDEPTTGVDAVSRKEFWEMLARLKDSGISIIVSTPYMDEARLCDRVGLIQNGKILSIDKPENITKQFEHDLFAVRSDDMHKLSCDLKLFSKTRTVFPFGQYLHLTVIENIEITLIEKYLIDLGHKQIVLEKIDAGIEDCFIELMRNEKS